ncbi:purH [Mytilus edulis]|uniref:PurH n=1 Tax=Mytilus edulis TaxID=6550 RepID=A0A8S3UBD1_MYTED|nr:purH [Mytilus edulis]
MKYSLYCDRRFPKDMMKRCRERYAIYHNNYVLIHFDISDLPLEFLDCIPTDEILDKLAPQIGQVYFQLGAVIGLSIGTLETIQSNNPRDLAAQNREVLFAWRKDRTVKPTIMVLIQALVNIGKGARCLQEVLKNVDLKTLKESEEVRGEGAISKEPKNTSEQKPHGKKKKSKKCSIA